MKQIIQNYKTGEIKLQKVPVPLCKAGAVLVQNICSLISVGTEKYMMDMAKKSLVGKAWARPDLVKQVIDKVKTEGVVETYRQAISRLDSPVPLGYSCAGKVIKVGVGADEFQVGDRVACFGSSYASHAEVVCVPSNLCVHIPKKKINSYSLSVNGEESKIYDQTTNNQFTNNFIPFEEAAFVGLGAIALHGVRLAELTFGENVAVIGLGLVGLATVQLLKAVGCSVIGTDIDEKKCQLAKRLGADEAVIPSHLPALTSHFSNSYGVDAVIITAATKDNKPILLAEDICRKKGRIILVGEVDIKAMRKTFWDKELSFVVSKAAGPGSLEERYERKGYDYPISYVRWTEKRNMEYFLQLVAQGKVCLNKLITHRFKIEDALKAYEMILNNSEPYIGVLLNYSSQLSEVRSQKSEVKHNKIFLKQTPKISQLKTENVSIGLIGAGLFANTTLLPAIKHLKNLRFRGIATTTGIRAHHTGKKYGFEYITTDYHQILHDPEIDCVFIVTRHNLHAKMVVEALKAKKHIFVEKPLCLNKSELKEIIETFNQSRVTNNCLLMVGFNRRFSPFVVKTKEWLGSVSEPLAINCRVNTGLISSESGWADDPEEGGGRIVGEACHFVDLIQYFTDSIAIRVYAENISSNMYAPSYNVAITLKMANGSIGSIAYMTNGDKAFSRERVEIFGGGAACAIENFKQMVFTKGGKRKKLRRFNVDRGHKAEFDAFFNSLRSGGPAPVDFAHYVYTTLATFAIEESLKQGKPIELKSV